MKKSERPKLGKQKATKPLGTRAFAAISAVEGMRLGKASRDRLRALKADASLSPDDRRAEVLRAYMDLARKDAR